LNDTLNGNPIKYSEIEVFLYDGITDVSFYLNIESGSLQLDETGEIDLIYSVLGSTPAKNYTLEVWVNGIFIYTNPVYPQFFNLGLVNLTNFANGIYELKVLDPDNINIFFFINGSPTLSFYWDLQPPELFVRGDIINFSVYITQSGTPVTTGTVGIYDVFNNLLLGSYVYNGTEIPPGFHEFLIDSSTWHGGLHRIRVNWSGYATFNTTYVIINETASIFASSNKASILRNLDNFITSGTVQENAVLLRGLRVNIVLLDSNFNDVSGYLIGPQSFTTNIFGYFQFDNSVSITSPEGQYYIRIDFNGTISAPGIFMNNYMVHSSSSLIPINVTAGTSLIPDTYWSDWESFAPDGWILGDTVHINGTLRWDNASAIEGVTVIVSVRWVSNGTWIASNFTVVTGLGGVFEGILNVSSNWPDSRIETNIWVTYIPSASEYVEGDEEQYP
jgi:hypothetical protein